LPGLRHDISILLGEHGLEGMGDDGLTRFEAATLDGFVDCVAEFPWKPDIGFPVTPFATCLTEALSPLAARFISHGFHPYCS